MLKKETALCLSVLLTVAFLIFLSLSQISFASPGAVVRPARQSAVGDSRININLADAAELQTLPGIGPALADSIVSWRDEHGFFQDAEALLEVPGIGEKTFSAVRDYIVTGGSDENSGRG